jgi:hypothetical protein
MTEVKITRVKFLTFHRPDSELVDIQVPEHWNQQMVRKVVRSEYSVHVVVSDRAPTEAEFYKIAIGKGETCGFVIPGSAIISPENPNSGNAAYCAYNLLIADAVCRASLSGHYELTSDKRDVATSREGIFKQDVFYLITWDKHITSPSTFAGDFAISLCAHGFVFPSSEELPTELMSTPPTDGSTLKLRSTRSLPEYVITILGSLVPYCKNPFLRFFYLYQVVEHLMGEDFDTRVDEVRTRFLDNANPSKVELREILEKFQDATREKARINIVMSPECPTTLAAANALLMTLGLEEPKATFAERLYKVRNTLFHDYGLLHGQGNEISSICEGLYKYLVEKKILA